MLEVPNTCSIVRRRTFIASGIRSRRRAVVAAIGNRAQSLLAHCLPRGFPLVCGHRATLEAPGSLKLEAPALLDPTTDDARLISFEMDVDGCRAVPSGGADKEDCARVVTDLLPMISTKSM